MTEEKGKVNWKFVLMIGVPAVVFIALAWWYLGGGETFFGKPSETKEQKESPKEMEKPEDLGKELDTAAIECLCEEEAGEMKLEEWGKLIGAEYTTENMDFNNDGLEEVIVMGSRCLFENHTSAIGGVTGNQIFCIFQGQDNKWVEIGFIGGEAYSVKDTKTGEYFDILTDADAGMAGCLRTISHYQWDGSYYVLTSEEIKNACKQEANLPCQNKEDCAEKCFQDPFLNLENLLPNCAPKYECADGLCECSYTCLR